MLLSQGPVHALLAIPTQAACQTPVAIGKILEMLENFGKSRILVGNADPQEMPK
jgi:hypothetical protein